MHKRQQRLLERREAKERSPTTATFWLEAVSRPQCRKWSAQTEPGNILS